MLALSGDFRDGRLRPEIDWPNRRSTVRRSIAFGFHSGSVASFFGVAKAGAIATSGAAPSARFVATGEQRPAGSLLDHGV